MEPKNQGNSVPENDSQQEPTPLLPIDGMPLFVQEFITKMQSIYRTPRDYWAGSAIMATALAIGKNFELVTKYKNNPVFWGVFVGDVSSGKTEPLDVCLRYFSNADNDKYQAWKKEVAEFERLSRMSRKERLEEGTDDLVKPQCFHFIIKDTTPEAMAQAHDINSRGLMINRDELKGWIDDFGRYSNSGEQSNLLTIWSQKGVSYHRKGTGTLNIAKPIINVAGGIHRELLHTLATDNRGENGFLARLVAFFPDNTEKQPYNNAMPDSSLLDAWDNYIKSLVDIKEPIKLRLPDRTAKIYESWYNENVKKINAETSPYLKGVYGKLDIILLRTSIILRGMSYVLDGVMSPEILPKEMEDAIQITEYFRATALKVYRQIFGEKKFGNYDRKDIAVWLTNNTDLSKSLIASSVLNSSRMQLNRLIEKSTPKGISLPLQYQNK